MENDQAIYYKEGQTQGAIGAVISLVVGVGVAVLVLVFVGVLGGQAYNIAESDINEIGTNQVNAQPLTILNGTEVDLGHFAIQAGTLSIYNASAPNTQLGLGNFTINYDAGTILYGNLDGAVTLNNTLVNANYTWGAVEIRTSVKNSVVSGFEALENTGDYLPLIVLGVIIFIVLGLVLGMTAFSGGGTGGGGSAL